MIFCNFPKGGSKTQKYQLLNFGRFVSFIGFQKKSDFGYFYLYLQHILGETKSEKSSDPLWRGGIGREEKKIKDN